MVTYSVKIAGTEYPLLNVHYIRSYKLELQAFTVEIPYTGESFSIDDFCEIFRDNQLVFKGRIKSIRKRGNNRLELKGYALLHSLKPKKAVNRVESNVYAGIQVSNQLAGTDLSAGTIQNGDQITMEYGSEENAKFDRLKVLQEIVFVMGYELYVHPDGKVDFKQQCGTDRSSEVVFKRGELLDDWVDSHTTSVNHKVERIIVIGMGQGIYMKYGIAGGEVGVPEKTINRKNLIDDNTCQKAANGLLADFQNTVEYGATRVIDTYEGHAYDVYDTIKIVDTTIGVEENYRIMEIERSFDANAGEETIIRICNLTKITSNAEFLVETGEGFVNDLKRRGEEFAQNTQLSTIGTGIGAQSGKDIDSAVDGADADSNVDSGVHQHNISLEQETRYTSEVEGHRHTYVDYYVDYLFMSGAHTHAVNSPTHGHGVSSPYHGHNITDPKHTH